MFYAKISSDTDFTVTAEERPQPYNWGIRAFETKAEREAAMDEAIRDRRAAGPCKRCEVEKYFGRDFVIYNGRVMTEYEYEMALERGIRAVCLIERPPMMIGICPGRLKF